MKEKRPLRESAKDAKAVKALNPQFKGFLCALRDFAVKSITHFA
jgi:hypothetical protein